MHRLSICLLLAFATPAAGQDDLQQAPMTGAEFEAHVAGRTITFRSAITDNYGVESYLSDRRVMWSAFDGTCLFGRWYESDSRICFLYEGDPVPKCWIMFADADGMRGIFVDRSPNTVIYEDPDRQEPLICNNLSS